jgi:N-acetylglucosamine-6-phosphate deacetylase
MKILSTDSSTISLAMFGKLSTTGKRLGLVDLQINGLFGVDFNQPAVTQEQWTLARSRLFEDGTTHFLPTLITDSIEALCGKLRGLASHCAHEPDKEGLATAVGIHLEGPFLSSEPGYVGAHPREHARPLHLDELKRLVDASEGQLRWITLAPECDPTGVGIEYLTRLGIRVAAGHCNSSLDQLRRAIDHGLGWITHLGNACPASLPRHDNVLNRLLSLRRELSATLIADGHHVPWWLLELWIECFGEDQVAIVSDAISAAGLPAGVHRLGERTVDVGSDGVPRSEDRSHFVGSGATLGVMRQRCEKEFRWSEERFRKVFTTNASRWLGLEGSWQE